MPPVKAGPPAPPWCCCPKAPWPPSMSEEVARVPAETDLLDPSNTVQQAHAIVLSGGSAYGLAAADGVMTHLESQGIGLAMDKRGSVVPIVPGAVIFDLSVGAWSARPDREFGAQAAANADPEVRGCCRIGRCRHRCPGRSAQRWRGQREHHLHHGSGNGHHGGGADRGQPDGCGHRSDQWIAVGCTPIGTGLLRSAAAGIRRGGEPVEPHREIESAEHHHRCHRHRRGIGSRLGSPGGDDRARRTGPGDPSRPFTARRRHTFRGCHRFGDAEARTRRHPAGSAGHEPGRGRCRGGRGGRGRPWCNAPSSMPSSPPRRSAEYRPTGRRCQQHSCPDSFGHRRSHRIRRQGLSKCSPSAGRWLIRWSLMPAPITPTRPAV